MDFTEQFSEFNNLAPCGTWLYDVIQETLRKNNQSFDTFEYYIYSKYNYGDIVDKLEDVSDYLYKYEMHENCISDRYICVNRQFAVYCIESECILMKILDSIPQYNNTCSETLIHTFFSLKGKYFTLRNDDDDVSILQSDINFYLKTMLKTYFRCMEDMGILISKPNKYHKRIVVHGEFSAEDLLVLFLELILNVGMIEDVPDCLKLKRKFILILYSYLSVWYNSEKDLPNNFCKAYNIAYNIKTPESLPFDLIKCGGQDEKFNFAPKGTKMYYMIQQELTPEKFRSTDFYLYSDIIIQGNTDTIRLVKVDFSIIHIFRSKNGLIEELQKCLHLKDEFNNKNKFEEHKNHLLHKFMTFKEGDQDWSEVKVMLDKFLDIYYGIEKMQGLCEIDLNMIDNNTYLCIMLEVLLNIGSMTYLENDKMEKRLLYILSYYFHIYIQDRHTMMVDIKEVIRK